MKGLYLGITICLALVTACTEETNTQNTGAQETEKALAFPGAEGFGKYTTGGRGGKVLVVSTLNDQGPGSLREAVEQEGARIIVFAVSGYIELKSPLNIENGNLTIAGQSAPGQGITIRNFPVKIHADNIIIRYIRSRMGDQFKVEDDAISALRQKDIIVDHCSFSWATDEAASFYDNENFTLQWSIISESLNSSVHAKGDHGYGAIWGGKGASFHHNLLAHHKSRLPRFNGARTHQQDQPELEVVDFRNNVIYNWMINSSYAGEEGNYNMVNNYYKPGPATEDSKRSRIIDPWEPYGSFYLAGNFMEGNPSVTQNNSQGVSIDEPETVLIASPVEVVPIKEQSAVGAFEAVLAGAGASFKRDEVDSRVVEEVRNGTAPHGKNRNGIIDAPEDVGGWPDMHSGDIPPDQDKDGMPDAWETENGLDPASAADASAFTLDKHYSNIEMYLNSLI